MLGNGIRKRLTEQNWLSFLKRESNPTQTWHRLRSKANRAINDLILLANSARRQAERNIRLQ
jgi:hypothetical protein